MRLTKTTAVHVRVPGSASGRAVRPTTIVRIRHRPLRREKQVNRLRSHVRRASELQSTPSPVSTKIVQRARETNPQALLKAWRCLSGALFAGAIASPVAAELQMPEFGAERVSLKLLQTQGGGGSEHKYYIGLGAGASRLEPDGESNGFRLDPDERDSKALKVFFGKQFLPHWRWEIGYTDAGQAGLTDGLPSNAEQPEVDYTIPSIAIDYLLREPSAKLNFYLRGGAALVQTESDDNRIELEEDSEVGGLLGVGAQWHLGNRYEARLGLESYGGNAAFASLALVAKLGRDKSTQLAPVSTARGDILEPVDTSGAAAKSDMPPVLSRSGAMDDTEAAALPENADQAQVVDGSPELREAQAQSARNRVCRSVDRELSGVSFDSGSADLSPQAKQLLDRVASALKRGPNIRVTVRGYTDSRGNASKNQLLSQKRAQAVASYLSLAVGNFNNSPRAIGMGESNPIASNETAVGRSRNRRIELNLRAGPGCDNAAIVAEVDDKTRTSAEKSPTISKAPVVVAVPTPAVVPGTSLKANFGGEKQACQVTDQVVRGLSFAIGQYQLDARAKRALEPYLAALRNDSSLQVRIKGHTDSIGMRPDNQLLSAKRAQSVADYLMDLAPQLSAAPQVLGQGEMFPLASNDSAEGRAKNRRIEISISGGRSCHLPVTTAGAEFSIPKPVESEEVSSDAEIKTQEKQELEEVSLPQAEPESSAQASASAAADVVEASAEQLSAATEMSQQDGDAEAQLPVISPIAEPALSDTLSSEDGGEVGINASACSGIDRVIPGVEFSVGKTSLNAQARRVLDPVIQLLRRDPSIKVVVEGHTDDSGSALNNMELSERRAKAVAAYLAGGAGLIKNPPTALGFGETKPLYSNASAGGRRGNRRIVLKLTGGHGCLSNEMLGGFNNEVPEGAVLYSESLVESDIVDQTPTASALQSGPVSSDEPYLEAVGRMSRGYGACGDQAYVIEPLDFAPGDDRLDHSDRRALMPLVTLWREKPELSIEVRGHTDNVGSAAGNRRLSQRRAESVVQFLSYETGLGGQQPTAVGLGESEPRASNQSERGRQLNRRIEVVLSGGERCQNSAAKAELEADKLTENQTLEMAEARKDVLPQAPESLTLAGGGSVAAADAVLACADKELLRTEVKFDTGAYFLDDHSRAALNTAVDIMRADPELQVEVQGHTDNVGTPKRNLGLSERRAEAVAQYLMHATGNIDNPPIAVGYGADMPVSANDSDTGRAQNRRIDILLSGGQNCDQATAEQVSDEISTDIETQWSLPVFDTAQLGQQPLDVQDQCYAVQQVVQGLSFEPAGFRLDARAKNALAPVLEILRDDPSLLVEVYGYSADYGDASFDHILAERRAETVADYLMVKSGNFDNIPVALGFGDLGEGVVADPQQAQLYRANRIELRLSKGRNCEQAVTGGISIRRLAEPSSTLPVAAALSETQGGGGQSAVLSTDTMSCELQGRVLDGVSFEAGGHELDRSSKLALNKVAEALLTQPQLSYQVHGHTDAAGDDAKNRTLSEWRARAVADYLARATGSWPQVAEAAGFGDTRPLASNDTASGRAVNRRIELQLQNKDCQQTAQAD